MHETTGARANSAQEGVTGLKSLGVRELNYKLCFLACAVHLADKDGWSHFREHDDEEGGAEEFDAETSARISSMASSPNLYQRMVNSIAVEKGWNLFSADVSQAFLRGLTFDEAAKRKHEVV